MYQERVSHVFQVLKIAEEEANLTAYTLKSRSSYSMGALKREASLSKVLKKGAPTFL